MSRLITLNKLDDLIELRNIYKVNGSTQLLGTQTLDNYIHWFEKEQYPKHIKVYTLPDVWKRSGLYLIVDRYLLMINALDNEGVIEDLKIALSQLDWSRGYKILGVSATHFETILQILSDMGLHNEFKRLRVMRLCRELSLKFYHSSLLPEFQFRRLNLEDATIVDDIWYSHHNGTLEFIRRLIQYNCNIGIYLKSTGELIAWCIRCNLGLLGMLHVKEAYRGRGFAKAIIKKLACQIAENGDDATTMISEKNLTSITLFKKLDFEDVALTNIIIAKRHKNSEIWSDELEARVC